MVLPNHPTKPYLKVAIGIDVSTLASKTDSASLRTKENNLNIDKFKTVPANSSMVSNLVENDVVKKTMYDGLVTKVNAIDTKLTSISGLVTKT